MAVKTEFRLTAENAQATAQICSRLDGIPLAIELAAALVSAFSPAQIASHLDDRFRLLTGGSRTAVPRLQTLRASIDWSYSLLAENERLLLLRLSVFKGGWTLSKAQDVCAFDGLEAFDVLVGLRQLVNKSLIYTISRAEGVTRYHHLETIRQYAREKLLESGSSEVLYDSHLDAFLKLAEQAKTHLRRHGHLDWLDRLELELDNLRVALTWALERDAKKGLHMAISLHWFFRLRDYLDEGERWLRRLQERISEREVKVNPALLAEAKALQAMLLSLMDRRGFSIAEEALNLAKVLGEKHKGIHALALQAMSMNSFDSKLKHKFLYQSLEIAEEIGDLILVTDSMNDLWHLEPIREKAKAYIDRKMMLSRELGDEDGLMFSHLILGYFYLNMEEFAQAIQITEYGIQIARKLRNRRILVVGLNQKGLIYYVMGEADKAIKSYQEGLDLAFDLGEPERIISVISGLVNVYILKRDWMMAEEYLQQAIETVRENGFPFWNASSCQNLAEMAWSSRKIETAVKHYQEAAELGQKTNDAKLDGMSAYSYGMASLLNENLKDAEEFFLIALRAYSNKDGFINMSNCLEGLALCSTQNGCFEHAVRLHGAAVNCRSWRKYHWALSMVIRDEVEDALEPVRTAMGEARYEELLQEGQSVPVENVVAYAEKVLNE